MKTRIQVCANAEVLALLEQAIGRKPGVTVSGMAERALHVGLTVMLGGTVAPGDGWEALPEFRGRLRGLTGEPLRDELARQERSLEREQEILLKQITMLAKAKASPARGNPVVEGRILDTSARIRRTHIRIAETEAKIEKAKIALAGA